MENSNNSEKNEKKKKMGEEIQRLYGEYLKNASQIIYNKLYLLIYDYCVPTMIGRLKMNGCYDDEAQDTCEVNASLAVWQKLREDYRKGVYNEYFLLTVCRIYRNKTYDYIRQYLTYVKNFSPLYIEELKRDENGNIIDVLPPTMTDEEREKEYLKYIYGTIFMMYLRSLLGCKKAPPGPLSLFYARILPHLTMAVSDSVMTSTKAAHKMMNGYNMNELKNRSENDFCIYINDDLMWGEAFVNGLKKILKKSGKTFGETVYTEFYSEKNTADNSNNIHKDIFDKTRKEIQEDKQLFELAKEYISPKSELHQLLERSEGV